MAFYCQLDYEHVPYPSPTSLNGNLANNGCGVCAASMVVEAMTGQTWPPEKAAQLAKSCGAREGFGTDMSIFAPVFSASFGLRYTATGDPKLAKAFLAEKQGLVIANTAGDREGWIGVFSDSRHYIVLHELAGDQVAVWDPMLHPGRYDVPGRAGKVHLEGTTAWADFSIVENDCLGRAYYLFWKEAANV